MKPIIAALVCLNLGIAAYLAYAFSVQPSRPAMAASEGANVSEAAEPTKASRTKFSDRIARGSKADRFDWRSLADEDLKQYALNLRSVQCPEETIRDIILAELNRQFASRESALKGRAEDRQPWEAISTSDRRSNESRLRQLLVQKKLLLREITGADAPVELPPSLGGRDIARFEAAFSAVPESKRDQVQLIQEKYWSQSDDIKRRTLGFLEPEDRDEFIRIKAERRQELAKVLSPGEIENYDIISSATATTLRSQLGGMNPTDEEFRKIFALTVPVDEQFSINKPVRETDDPNWIARRKQAEQDLQESLRSTLGDERYADLERSRDPAYKGISSAMQEAGLPKESIVQVYETQKLLQAESKRLMQDQTLLPEQRAQALQSMQAQGEQTLRQMLGDQAFEALKGRVPTLNPGQPSAQQRQQIVVPAPTKP